MCYPIIMLKHVEDRITCYPEPEPVVGPDPDPVI